MSLILEIIGYVLLLSGAGFVFIGGVGALRFPNFYTRVHAASLTDAMGAILVLTGMMFLADGILVVIKLAAILLFLILTSPTATYALANAALLAGVRTDLTSPEKGDE